MEIVNSCEASNGGCSHGCSHSSAGPVCTCPRGFELAQDQKTCIGASWPLAAAPRCRSSPWCPQSCCLPQAGGGPRVGLVRGRAPPNQVPSTHTP